MRVRRIAALALGCAFVANFLPPGAAA
ncbi:MAG: hypothetical protein QOI11_1278, partial [Candidatus Eremiobacteraeota bacterium]|nr:hypothetical protein [Candidatus Eremiobacteraeota bacterium]